MTVDALSACSLLDAVSGHLVTGTVRGVFSGAAYVDAGDLVVTISYPETGHVPYGVIVPRSAAPLLAALHPGADVEFRPGQLRFPEIGGQVSFVKAERWSSQLTVASLDRRRLAANLSRLQSALRSGPSETEGLAPLSGHITRLPKTEGKDHLNRFCQVALPVLSDAVCMWRDGRLGNVASELQRLLGLGPGLTPSGDDFVIGTMAALWSASGVDRGNAETYTGLARRMGCPDTDRTTGVGAFFVRQASVGRFPEKLHTLMTALCRDDEGPVTRATQSLFELGATSGRDMAVGVVFGAHLVFGGGGASRDSGGSRAWPFAERTSV